MRRFHVAWMVTLLAVVPYGCAVSDSNTPYRTILQTQAGQSRDARMANERGLSFVEEGNYDEAEAAFREALAADLNFAAAHNNLGLVLLQKGRFYEAAREFSYAKKLRPMAREPVINLARLYEAIGWQSVAEKEYQKADSIAGRSAHVDGAGQVIGRSDVYTKRLRHGAEARIEVGTGGQSK